MEPVQAHHAPTHRLFTRTIGQMTAGPIIHFPGYTIEETRIRHGGRILGVTASIGTATFPEHALGKTDLIQMADEALYHSKRNGKNRISAYAVAHGNETRGLSDSFA